MSSKLKLKATAGGSVSLQVDGTLTTDESITIDEFGAKSPIVMSGQIGSSSGPTGPALLTFDEFWVDVGGITWNATTKRFTVPKAGIYRITMNPFKDASVLATRILVGINNDAPTTSTHKGHCYSSVDTYDTLNINSIVDLSANDYIVFYLQVGKLYNIPSDRFNQFTIEYLGLS